MVLFTGKQNTPQPEKPEIDYPCTWSYKVIGQDCTILKDVIQRACGKLDVKITHSHTSSGGKYHSLEAKVEVENERTRISIYEKIRSDPAVKIVL